MMRVEQIGDATLYLGDCRDVLPTLAHVDAVVTDPPYGVGFTGKVTKYTNRSGGEAYLDTPEYFDQVVLPAVYLALQKATRAAIFCGTRRLQSYPAATDIGGIICPNGGGMSSWGFGCYHPIVFYGSSPYVSAGLGARPTATAMYHPGMRVTGENGIEHPCPKPIAFMKWALEAASLPGHLVLDPFMGSGTTGVACAQLGRRFIGIEIEPSYFDIACRRIDEGLRQGDLLVPRVSASQETLPIEPADGSACQRSAA